MTREQYYRNTKFILNISFQLCTKLRKGDRILVGESRRTKQGVLYHTPSISPNLSALGFARSMQVQNIKYGFVVKKLKRVKPKPRIMASF